MLWGAWRRRLESPDAVRCPQSGWAVVARSCCAQVGLVAIKAIVAFVVGTPVGPGSDVVEGTRLRVWIVRRGERRTPPPARKRVDAGDNRRSRARAPNLRPGVGRPVVGIRVVRPDRSGRIRDRRDISCGSHRAPLIALPGGLGLIRTASAAGARPVFAGRRRLDTGQSDAW